jgi:uncharacterized protein (TIGR02001 family)
MNLKLQRLVAVLALAGSAASAADVSVTPALTSDYAFRGISRSALDPSATLRIGVDGGQGLRGAFTATSVDFGRGGPDLELLPELALSLGTVDGVDFETGARYFAYDGESSLNHPELWVGARRGALALRADLSWDFFGTGENAWHLEAGWEQPLRDGFRLQAQIGYSGGDYWDRFYGDGYVDFSIGAARRFGHFDVALAYVDASDLPDGPSDVFSTDGRLWLSVKTVLPWSAD